MGLITLDGRAMDAAKFRFNIGLDEDDVGEDLSQTG
jgi:hypothetical protein